MGQVASMGKVKTHEAAVNGHNGLVDLEVGGGAGQALDVYTPLGRVEVEGVEGTLLAEVLDLVNVLVAAVVSGAGVALGVLVGHGRAESVEDGTGSDVLRGNEDDGLALALNLLLHDLGDLRVGVDQRLLQHLAVSQNQQSLRDAAG